MKKELKINILLFFVTLVICVFLAEIALNFFVQPYYGIPPGAFVADEVLDYKPKSGFSSFFINNERVDKYVNLTVNSYGFRDKEYEIEKKNIRAAFIGDSMTMAEQVNLNETFTKLVEENLGYDVMNFGVSGYGTKQAFEFYKQVGEQFNPDVVVYFFTPNDLKDNLEKRFTVVAGERLSYSYKDKPLWKVKLQIFLYRNSALLRTLYRLRNSDGVTSFENVDLYEHYGGERAWEEMGKVISEMKSHFASKNIRFVVVRNPSILKTYHNAGDWDYEKWKEMNVTIYDPADLFIENKDKKLFYDVDKHLTPEGHKLFAEYLISDVF